MKNFKNVIDELITNMPELLNDAYARLEESNARIEENFSYKQIQTLEKMKTFGWGWSLYNNDTGVITCTNHKNKSKVFISPDGTYKR